MFIIPKEHGGIGLYKDSRISSAFLEFDENAFHSFNLIYRSITLPSCPILDHYRDHPKGYKIIEETKVIHPGLRMKMFDPYNNIRMILIGTRFGTVIVHEAESGGRGGWFRVIMPDQLAECFPIFETIRLEDMQLMEYIIGSKDSDKQDNIGFFLEKIYKMCST